MPSRYDQMRAIRVSQNRNKGSPTQEVARERRKPNATPIHSGTVWTMWRRTKLLARPTPSTNARMITRQQIAIETGAVDLDFAAAGCSIAPEAYVES